MEKLRFQCRVEKAVKNHGVMVQEFELGDGMVFVQCLSCGIMGIMNRGDAHGGL